MFYTKTKLSNQTDIKTIIADNVFTICPKCGKEISVDLVNVIKELPEFDFFSTRIYCNDCSEKEHKN